MIAPDFLFAETFWCDRNQGKGGFWADIADRAPSPAEHAEANELESRALESLGELKDVYRVVLYLRLFEELSYVEIANRLGLKDGTVRIRARRGFQSLRRKLAQQGITPECLEGGLT